MKVSNHWKKRITKWVVCLMMSKHCTNLASYPWPHTASEQIKQRITWKQQVRMSSVNAINISECRIQAWPLSVEVRALPAPRLPGTDTSRDNLTRGRECDDGKNGPETRVALLPESSEGTQKPEVGKRLGIGPI